MTTLDPNLSEEAQAVKTRWSKKILERLLKSQSRTVQGMSLRKITLLGSNLASEPYLKRIEIPHSLCCDFGGYKTFTTRWSGGTVQV